MQNEVDLCNIVEEEQYHPRHSSRAAWSMVEWYLDGRNVISGANEERCEKSSSDFEKKDGKLKKVTKFLDNAFTRLEQV